MRALSSGGPAGAFLLRPDHSGTAAIGLGGTPRQRVTPFASFGDAVNEVLLPSRRCAL
jgi:hypothetical protein